MLCEQELVVCGDALGQNARQHPVHGAWVPDVARVDEPRLHGFWLRTYHGPRRVTKRLWFLSPFWSGTQTA